MVSTEAIAQWPFHQLKILSTEAPLRSHLSVGQSIQYLSRLPVYPESIQVARLSNPGQKRHNFKAYNLMASVCKTSWVVATAAWASEHVKRTDGVAPPIPPHTPNGNSVTVIWEKILWERFFLTCAEQSLLQIALLRWGKIFPKVFSLKLQNVGI